MQSQLFCVQNFSERLIKELLCRLFFKETGVLVETNHSAATFFIKNPSAAGFSVTFQAKISLERMWTVNGEKREH